VPITQNTDKCISWDHNLRICKHTELLSITSHTQAHVNNKDIVIIVLMGHDYVKLSWYLLLFKTTLRGNPYSIVIRDFYRKSTVSLWDNNGGWQRIIWCIHGQVRLRESQWEREFSRKGFEAQLDFWLGNRNNTIGYRPEISDLNRFKRLWEVLFLEDLPRHTGAATEPFGERCYLQRE
jgi:hypothetical protein